MDKNGKNFYSDLNLVELAIFSTTKGVKGKKRETIIFDKGRHVLDISYGERAPTWFDRRVLATIEFIFFKKYSDLDYLKTRGEERISEETERYLSEYNGREEYRSGPLTIESLSEVQQQHIIYLALEQLQRDLRLYLTMREINSIVFPDSRGPSMIKKSLEVLSSTRIYRKSTYSVGREHDILEYPEFPLIVYSSVRTKGRDEIVVSLNPFHLYNLVNRRFISTDLDFLNSFRSPIAGRLAEYIKPRRYGAHKYGHEKVILVYSEICEYLRISTFTNKSRIIQQLKQPLDELVERGVIVHWSIEPGLFSPEIECHFSYSFFKAYYESLRPELKQQAERDLQALKENEEQYRDFVVTVGRFLDQSGIDSDSAEYAQVREYYMRYRILNG